jgi:hypothetical protein
MSTKPAKKKPRLTSSYHDSVPSFNHDYHDIHAREERLHKTGIGTMATTAAIRVGHKSDDHWNSSSSWIALDDTELALDPNGEWYDEAVDQHVMQEGRPSNLGLPGKLQKRRSQVSVSSKIFFSNQSSYLFS